MTEDQQTKLNGKQILPLAVWTGIKHRGIKCMIREDVRSRIG